MSISGPSPLGTLMVQRVEAALGNTISQQANIATGARPDAVTQPGQPDKVDPAKNPPPKGQEGSRKAADQGGRQALGALARNDPEIAKLLAARNAPMTAYTASAPTSLGNAAKAILALFQQFPDARPAVSGRAPLLPQSPGQSTGAQGGTGSALGASGAGAMHGGAAAGAGGTPGAPLAGATGQLDARAVQALTAQTQGESQAGAREASAGGTAAGAVAGAAARAGGSNATPGATASSPANAANSAASTTTAAGTAAGSLPVNPGMAGQLAMALSHALQGSGLFYEAHLREFAFGRRTLAQMNAEPQAQVGQDTGRAAGAESGARANAEYASSSAANTAQSSQVTQNAQAGAQAGSQVSAQLAGALLGLDPSTHALVRQQLETLATQSFAWQGEPWPGSEMEWEVQRREPREGDGTETESWATRLKLQLPGLGEVQARISLAGNQLVLHLASPEGAELMADHSETLRNRLLAQGLQLSQLSISRDAHTAGTAATEDGRAT